MAEVINMPRLSDTMEEGVVAKWLKKVGDEVSEGDILAEIETDKATMEFESFHSGVLLHVGLQEGETAPVDTLLAIIGEKGEDISGLLSQAKDSSKPEEKASEKEEASPKSEKSAEVPEGVEIVTMPRLSDTMTEGTVATWLKKVGDKVTEGDILAEIETDKATMEFESFYAGTLLYIGIQEGGSAPVDSLLAIIGPAGLDVTDIAKNYSAQSAAPKKEEATPAPEKTAEASQDNATPSVGTPTEGRVFASPLAKKIAAEKGYNLSQIKGSGENGRIVKADVENFTPSVASQEIAQPAVAAYQPVGAEHFEDKTNSQMRKTIAKRLGESKFTAPHYYLTIEVSMDQAIASRQAINAIPDTKVSFNDMVIKAVAMALRKHPQVNTQWKDSVTRYNQHIHVGVAVAVEDGLVVPVLKFTDQLTLTQIGSQVKDLAGKARNKKLQPSEMEGSTFTVSNLGMFGIEEFTSIINQPNAAILSVGAIIEKPVVREGQIVVGNQMKLTLACDHRTVDGATGAQFLQTLKLYMENPVTMLA
ncbi:MAG: pyruvate dehydrogenase complex dihydrolipoamide acetyltransferase [Flavobacteriaceae bacterium]|nr:pyruvate dehydrogenase complex dihydrolipoamide acetyltransferase [Flavobacteriaceae bacterium]